LSTELLIQFAIFAVALFFLIKSADYFVDYSEKLGLSLGVPQFIIGVTIISMGTSLPELITSIFSIARGEAGFVSGNVIGSNIANIFLVVGITSIIAKRVEVTRSIIRLDLPLLVGSGAILILTMKDGVFTFTEAILSIIGFIIYIIYNVTQHKETPDEQKHSFLSKLKIEKKPPFKWIYLLWILVSAVFLYFSAGFTIDSVIEIASMLKIDTAVIAITAVAVGTSLPELLVSVVAAKKGNFEM
jgi:cation:H+ antiporter